MDNKASSGIPESATIMTTMGAHPGTKYFLVVVVGKVQVLFGLAQCFALV
jgi:hypothetical protein